jgi:hypothetical protein
MEPERFHLVILGGAKTRTGEAPVRNQIEMYLWLRPVTYRARCDMTVEFEGRKFQFQSGTNLRGWLDVRG